MLATEERRGRRPPAETRLTARLVMTPKRKETKMILKNDFHNTQATAFPRQGRLSKRQLRRLEKQLCGMSDCECSGPGGVRMPRVVLEEQPEGDAYIRTYF